MNKLKLSLKKEIISDLEAKEVKGGRATIDNVNCESNELGCPRNTHLPSCAFNNCIHSLPGEVTCFECR